MYNPFLFHTKQELFRKEKRFLRQIDVWVLYAFQGHPDGYRQIKRYERKLAFVRSALYFRQAMEAAA